jgi:aminoglycoside phosphotransferase
MLSGRETYCVVVHDAAFPAVEPSSAVYDPLQPLRDLIAGDPGLAVGQGASVRAEVLPGRTREGGWGLRRCYWSVQRPDPAAVFGFRARTLFWDGRTAEARIVDFPAEPAMDWLVTADGALSSHGEQARLRILRYIPLRRVTFLLEGGPGLPPRVIAKTKRAKSIVRATRALVSARRAAERAGVDTFRVPQPLRLDAHRRLLYLAELPGLALPEVLAAGELDRTPALHRLGRVHREVHELGVTRVRVRRNEDWLAMTAAAADQIGALTPSVRREAAALVARLARTMPDDADLVFCQGDFVPSQILCDPSGWAVLDFDDSHHADPHAEVTALFVALGRELPHDSPAAAAAARRAYLAGYVERAGRPLDPARWRWFASVAHVRYLARRLVKGRALPGEAGTVLDEIGAGGADPPDD